jgi:hypothetical protein
MAHRGRFTRRNRTERDRVLGWHAHPLRPGAIAKVFLQLESAVAARSQALQRDIGREKIVARADGGIAIDPVARLEMRRVGTDRMDAADRTGAGHHGQVELISPFAAEYLVRIRQDTRGGDIDDDLAGAERGLGDVFDLKLRSKGFQYGSLHWLSRWRG